jgi:hypothetical protein
MWEKYSDTRPRPRALPELRATAQSNRGAVGARRSQHAAPTDDSEDVNHG